MSHSPFVPFIILCCGTALILLLLPLVCVQKIFYKGPLILSAIIWLVLTATVNVYVSVLPNRTVDDDLAVVFYIIIVLYTMLPLSLLWSLLFGILSTLLQLLIAGLFTSNNTENLVFQVSFLLKWHRFRRKPVSKVSDQVRHKPACTATEDG